MSLLMIILLLFLLIAAWQDYRNYRIRNEFVISGLILGLSLNSFLPAGIGALDAFIGCSIGLLLLLPLHMLRIMGAGDVKLMAMVGAFVGPNDIFGVFLSTLIAGGVLALIISLHQGMFRKLIDNLFYILKRIIWINNAKLPTNNLPAFETNTDSISKLPYAVAIAIGTVIFLVINHITIH